MFQTTFLQHCKIHFPHFSSYLGENCLGVHENFTRDLSLDKEDKTQLNFGRHLDLLQTPVWTRSALAGLVLCECSCIYDVTLVSAKMTVLFSGVQQSLTPTILLPPMYLSPRKNWLHFGTCGSRRYEKQKTLTS